MLTPHHGVHRQLTRGGAATEDLANLCVFVILETQGAIGLNLVWGCDGVVYGVGDVGAHASVPSLWVMWKVCELMALASSGRTKDEQGGEDGNNRQHNDKDQ